MFYTSAPAWIYAAKAFQMGQIFKLAMDQREGKKGLFPIEDLGKEYQGAPKFGWIFYFKKIWYNPVTWFRKDRYINPNDQLQNIEYKNWDIIVARRVPYNSDWSSDGDYPISEVTDDQTTVIL